MRFENLKIKRLYNMKKLSYWMMAMLVCSLPFVKTSALVLPEDEPVLVYYMPLTQVRLTAEYDEIVTEVGQFYQYSERYLGIKDVVTKAERQFVLKGIKYRLMEGADTTRMYVLHSDKNVKLQWVSLSPYGTLVGYNVPTPQKNPSNTPSRKNTNSSKQETFIGTESTHLMPLLEEQLMASSTAKMAEGAAKQIYRIREMRLNLLAGDVEKAPADGAAVRRILEEMDKREQELTALFVGRRTVTHHKHYAYYTPTSTSGSQESCILFRFSKYYGVVAVDDLSGEPVNLTLSKNTHKLAPAEKPQKTAPSLYYNLPGTGVMRVTYGDEELLNHSIDVAQWGVSVPLNSALLATTPRITFNPLTGAIVSIEK